MKNLFKVLVVIVSFLIMTGCAPKSYVDEKYKNITIKDITKINNTEIIVNVEFQRDGKHYPSVDNILKTAVENTLRASGYLIVNKDSNISIKVTANNFGDIGKAALKGFGTGLTLGLAGSTVTDFYDINISFNDGNSSVAKNYSHAIHSTIGNSKPVYPNTTPLTPNEAFKEVVKDVVLKFIIDLQANKSLK